MDVALRARHDALIVEFPCAATELRIVRTPPGSAFLRTIDAFCTDTRAARFGSPLVSYDDFCASCLYFQPVFPEGETIGEESEQELERVAVLDGSNVPSGDG